MAAVTYDAQSLMVDGRRVWLVGFTIEYSRTPRSQWRMKIRAAKEAGINCITTTALWNLHETQPRHFAFEGESDLRHFIEIIGEEGLFCCLRVGPYAGASFEGGGLPAWLNPIVGMKLREANRPFLDACARWFAALMEQVGELQITADKSQLATRGSNLPILLMQIEHDWRCHHPEQATQYLGELIRFLREEGCQLPLLEANNCWQDVEGAFSTWRGGDDLCANMRQFRFVQQSPPAQQFPLIVSELPADDTTNDMKLAQVLAAGSQFTVNAGGDVQALQPIRRLTTFANQFGHVFANLHHDRPHAMPLPQGDDHPLTIVHQHGTQGDVVFLFKSRRDNAKQADLLMPDGQSLSVPLGRDGVAWIVLHVNLAGVAMLDHTNLRPLAFLDRRMLVLFGPARAAGVVCINGSEIDVIVPGGTAPVVMSNDGFTLVVLNEAQVDATCITPAGLHLGVSGVDGAGSALPHRDFKQAMLIASDGTIRKVTTKPIAKTKPAPRLTAWSAAAATALIDGASENFREIQPGASLDGLAPAAHHGWYRLGIKAGKFAGSLLAPHWADRVHVFSRGKSIALLDDDRTSLREPFTLKATNDVTLLAACDTRICEGWRLGETRGLAGDLYQVKPVKLGRPKIELSRVPDATPWRAFLNEVSYQSHPTSPIWSWVIKPLGRHAIILRISELPCRVLVVVNGKVVGGYDPVASAGEFTITLDVGNQITAGRNTIALALMDPVDRFDKIDPRRFVKMYDAVANLTSKAAWSFAPLTIPTDPEFSAMGKRSPRGLPCWFRANFSAACAAALALQLTGMSGGQVWLNGRALSHYSDEAILPLPATWLRETGENVVTIFDELGALPRLCRLVVQE